MRKIRTLVVDDEPFARARIVKLLGELDYITVLGECKNGKEALKGILDYRPDLVLLDIQMPDFTGFEVLKKNELQPQPFIIFVTAFDQYALKAFDVHAVDYLLKPYDNERFFKAVEHAKDQILQKDQANLHKKMVRVLEDYAHKSSEEITQFEIKDKGRIKRVDLKDVYWIETDGNYLKLHTDNKSFLIRQTLQSLEETLTANNYLKIHRSILVNTFYIKNIRYKGNNQYQILLKNEEKLTSSRSNKDNIITFLEEEEIRKSNI